MTNTTLWDSVCVTDPLAVKPITGKPYKGNSPKPYWLIRRATEVFGPCGKGWGVEVKSESFYRMSDTDVMHTAVVRFWYILDNERCEIEQMGQTKACYAKSSGGLMVDEDAGKKTVTDGMTKCMSMIGFAGDIFSGRWDDSSYVEWAAEQYTERKTLTEDQCTVINDLVKETNSDKAKFLALVSERAGLKVEQLEQIPADAYDALIKLLNAKKEKQK